MITHSEVGSVGVPEGAGTAVIGGDFSQQRETIDPMLELGFIKNQELQKKFEVFKDASSMHRPPKPDRNLWDSENFSSINNQLPIYPRKKGFVEFSKQTVRPDLLCVNSVHEGRFDTIDLFPNCLSQVKH